MKTALKVFTLLVALLAFHSCNKDNEDYNHRSIVYFVDGEEHHVDLTSDGEWDELLGKLLDYTVDGSTVVFYNADLAKSKADCAKGDVKYSTSDRNKMKAWCKKMEGKGMTVTITYDKHTREWNGVATKGRPKNTTE